MAKNKLGRKNNPQIVSDLHYNVSQVREAMGLRPLEPATVTCLTCGREFQAWDKRLNRRCQPCKDADYYEEVPLEDCDEADFPELWDTSLMEVE